MSRKDTILDVLRRAQSQAGVQEEQEIQVPVQKAARREASPARDLQQWLREGLVLPRVLVYGSLAVLVVLAWGVYRLGYQSGGIAMERELAARVDGQGARDSRPIWNQEQPSPGERGEQGPAVAKDEAGSGGSDPLPDPKRSGQDPVVPVATEGDPARTAFRGLQVVGGKVQVLRIYTASYSEGNDRMARHLVQFLAERLPKLGSSAMARAQVFGVLHEPKQSGQDRMITVNIGMPEGLDQDQVKALLGEIGEVKKREFQFPFTTRGLRSAYVVSMTPSELGRG